ncbi:hypothetical protein BV911_11885 [Pseudoruegeria sp. SK021]|nr:hypothetical protein BV911_11885 [Pseudoruegeria sp. SK021]
MQPAFSSDCAEICQEMFLFVAGLLAAIEAGLPDRKILMAAFKALVIDHVPLSQKAYGDRVMPRRPRLTNRRNPNSD